MKKVLGAKVYIWIVVAVLASFLLRNIISLDFSR